jgi:hypothetical protein
MRLSRIYLLLKKIIPEIIKTNTNRKLKRKIRSSKLISGVKLILSFERMTSIESYFKNRKFKPNDRIDKYPNLSKLPSIYHSDLIDTINYRSNDVIELLENEINLKRYSDLQDELFVKSEEFEEYLQQINYHFDLKNTKIFHSMKKFKRRNPIKINEKEIEIFFTDEILRGHEIDWDHCFIIGSSISRLMRRILQEEDSNDDYNQSDVDIVVCIEEENDFVTLRKTFSSFIRGKECKVSKKHENLIAEINGVNYEFIPIIKDAFFTFILSFHFSCVYGFYNKKEGLKVTPICLLSNLLMTNLLINETHISNYQIFTKYLNKGYSFVLNEQEYSQIISFIEV